MRRTNRGFCRSLFIAIALPALTGSYPASAQADVPALASAHEMTNRVTPIKDLQVTLTVTQIENKELDKIGKDFSLIYRLKNIALYYKSADRMRLESSSHLYGDALLISNGASVFYAVPRMRIRRTEDLSDSPSRRQSLLELTGIILTDTLKLMQVEFIKMDTLDGKAVEIYDLKYQAKSGGTRYRVWLDPVTRVTLKREWYDSAGKLRATFTYVGPHEVATNVWLPVKCEVRNSEGVLAAVLNIKDAKVNQKLGDELFEITP